MLGKLLQSYRAMLPKRSSNEAPATYVSKPWHHKNWPWKRVLSETVITWQTACTIKTADFVCGCFAILDFFEEEIVLLGMPVAKVATYILKRNGSFSNFSYNLHHNGDFKFPSKIVVVNIFSNNEQRK